MQDYAQTPPPRRNSMNKRRLERRLFISADEYSMTPHRCQSTRRLRFWAAATSRKDMIFSPW